MLNPELFSFLAQGESLQKLSKGDISEVIATALTNAVNIQAPTFFANGGGPQSTLTSASESFLCDLPSTPSDVLSSYFETGQGSQPPCAHLLLQQWRPAVHPYLIQ